MTEGTDQPPSQRGRKQAAAAKKAPAKKQPAKKAAAKKQAPKLGSSGGKGGRPSRAELERKLQDSIEKGAGLLIVAGAATGNDALGYDGRVIEYRAPQLAAELYKLSTENATVRKALEAIYSTGKQLDSLTLLLGTVVPILVAHGKLPRSAMGMPGVGARELTEQIGQPPERTPEPIEAKGTEAEPLRPPSSPPWAGLRKSRPSAEPAPEPAPEPPADDHSTVAADSTLIEPGTFGSADLSTSLLPPLADDQ